MASAAPLLRVQLDRFPSAPDAFSPAYGLAMVEITPDDVNAFVAEAFPAAALGTLVFPGLPVSEFIAV